VKKAAAAKKAPATNPAPPQRGGTKK
jgi:hypothetical protein